jgi:DNA primase
MTTHSVIQEIKDRLDIVEVVGRYVALQKTGHRYKGLCPFHAEKTPSFFVFPETGTWKCFGCGAGGDVFTFVEKRENLPFADVLRMLAKEAGVSLRETRPEERDAIQRLRDIHTEAAGYFQSLLLTHPEAARAREYLQRRGLAQETVEQFQLGYARDGWEHLIRHLKARGFSLEEMVKAGLAVTRDGGGAYDRFRNRIIIPIRDPQGRIIAFGGRILGDGEPKYLNSPQTPIFDKSQVIFGLDMARRAIRAKDQVVLVEGYMDVISAHQHGFKNVVAAMGTSITPKQIHRLSRYTRNFVFALDADMAGDRATWRGVMVVQEALSQQNTPTPGPSGLRNEKRMVGDVRIAIMPEGMDPDDVLRQDPERWRALIENAIPVVDYIIQKTAADYDLATATGKSQFVAAVLPTLSKVGDVIQRRHYIHRVATLAHVRERDVEEALAEFERRQRRARKGSGRTSAPVSAAATAEPPPPDLEPPAEVVAGASEEPPLWTEGGVAPSPEPEAAPSVPQTARLIGPEEHLLGLIMLNLDALMSWLDEELASLELDPLFVDDFSDPLNRALFQRLEDFRMEEDAMELADFMAGQDDLAAEHFDFLWQYARRFESSKPRFVQESHLKREAITTLLRLRIDRIKASLQQLEVAIRDATSPEERRELDLHILTLMEARRHLEYALSRYSQTMHWTHQRRFYPPASLDLSPSSPS